MSAEAFSWALQQKTGSVARKAVLLVLGNHAHADGGGCWPSVQTVAKQADLTPRAVQNALRALEGELGLING